MITETSFSGGDGNITLSPLPGRRGFFESFGAGGDNMFFYHIRHDATAEWESGTGHMKDAVTLCRDTIISSSNDDAPVSFAPGAKTVVNDPTFEYMDFTA